MRPHIARPAHAQQEETRGCDGPNGSTLRFFARGQSAHRAARPDQRLQDQQAQRQPEKPLKAVLVVGVGHRGDLRRFQVLDGRVDGVEVHEPGPSAGERAVASLSDLDEGGLV